MPNGRWTATGLTPPYEEQEQQTEGNKHTGGAKSSPCGPILPVAQPLAQGNGEDDLQGKQSHQVVDCISWWFAKKSAKGLPKSHA